MSPAVMLNREQDRLAIITIYRAIITIYRVGLL
jgi:hypothetical protein